MRSILGRSNPATKTSIEMRIRAYQMRQKLYKLESDLTKIEARTITISLILDEYDARRGYLRASVVQLEKVVQQMKAKIYDALERYYLLVCTIVTLLEEIVNLQSIAEEIIVYSDEMTSLINQGLIRAGDYVQVEYTEGGFAKIHANFPPYAENPVPEAQCIQAIASRSENSCLAVPASITAVPNTPSTSA